MNSAIKALRYLGAFGYDKRQLDYQEFAATVASTALLARSYSDVLEIAKLSHYIHSHWEDIKSFADANSDWHSLLAFNSSIATFKLRAPSDAPSASVFFNYAFGGKKDYALIRNENGKKAMPIFVNREEGRYTIFPNSRYYLKFSMLFHKVSIYRTIDGNLMGNLVYRNEKLLLKKPSLNLALDANSDSGFRVYRADYLDSLPPREAPSEKQALANVQAFANKKKLTYDCSIFSINHELASKEEAEFCYCLALGAAKLATDILDSKDDEILGAMLLGYMYGSNSPFR